MKQGKYAVKLSYIAIIIIISHSLLFQDFWKSWKKNETQFVWDVNTYYSYLPAAFVHNDLTFSYINKDWTIVAPNGAKVPKGTCGMAIMYAPFFLIGHKIAINSQEPLTGFSQPYSEMVHYGSLIYALIGFIFLRKVLSRFFPDAITALTMLCLFFGTNLFYYIVGEGEMSHGYLFCLFNIFVWLVIKWHEKPNFRFSLFMGLTYGLIVLIRPTEIIIGLVFLLYGVKNHRGIKTRGADLLKNWKLLTVIALGTLISISPQLIYWKWLTGQFLFFSYGSDERFYWGDPQFINVLFSYRKGWLLYTPLMTFAILGMFFSRKKFPEINLGLLLYFFINLYLISCWWCWWYGGGMGMRSLVQSYGVLAFFIAAFIQTMASLQFRWKANVLVPITKYAVILLTLGFIWLNLIQSYQYNKRMLHYDSMTKKSYWLLFGKFEFDEKELGQFWASLKPIDYDRACKGQRNQ
jgi:hypothetical protein